MPQTTEVTVGTIADTAIIGPPRFFTATGNITSGTFINADATAGAFTLTLPLASQIPGRVLVIIKTDVSANAVTVDGAGSETINGALTQALNAQYNSITIRSTGFEWLITAST